MKLLLVGEEVEVKRVYEILGRKNDENLSINMCFWNSYKDVQAIKNTKADIDVYIVICKNDNFSNEIINMLTLVFGIDMSKIINYYTYYKATIPFMTVNRRMSKAAQKIKGMVLGISHAEVGIIPEILGDAFVNLAVSSQDIYFNLKTLVYCINNYGQRILELEYLIIDMFDYTYFNYDISRANGIFGYLSCGGLQDDEHNYKLNKKFNFSFEEGFDVLLQKRYKNIEDTKVDTWYNIFGDIHALDGYTGFSTEDRIYNRNKIVDNRSAEEYDYNKSIVRNRYEDTIAENITLFEELIKVAKIINPNIKIACLLMPRYGLAQEKSAYLYEDWKKEFYDIMGRFQKKYGIAFWDMKDSEIANRQELYQDIAHFNYLGAIEFSEIVAGKLREL